MTGNDYQIFAMRTNDGRSTLRLGDIMTEFSDDVDVGGVIMGCMGLSGESGELVDLIKKWMFHGAGLDMKHLERELGDILWYVACIAESFGLEMDKIMETNIQKLKNRYPKGFDEFLSAHRKAGDI